MILMWERKQMNLYLWILVNLSLHVIQKLWKSMFMAGGNGRNRALSAKEMTMENKIEL